MIRCKKCGFPLDARPNTKSKNSICLACINYENKKNIDFKSRQELLTEIIKENNKEEYGAVIAVSGGKDSHMIVKRLIENHSLKNPLLVTVTDEFTHTQAGLYNINNLVERYGLDHIQFRFSPKDFKENTLKDFENELHPLKWIEEKIYNLPKKLAKQFGIRLVFFGENSAFEYGESEFLNINHPLSSPEIKVLFMGAFYPYSITDSLEQARSIGFKDLDDFNEWPRQGSIDQFTQIDSIGYLVQLWTKYPKFGFQRVTDIATRFVREGKLTREQAIKLIEEHDEVCDPTALKDFCRCIDITEQYFWEIVKKFDKFLYK